MAMFVKGDAEKWKQWHIGETLVIPKGRVITFQADCDELDAILKALEHYGVYVVQEY